MKTAHFIIVLMLIHLSIAAQNIQGLIVNEIGAPLHGANVYVPSLLMGTSTNSEGKFILNLPSHGNYQLEISFIGYHKKRIESATGHEVPVQIQLSPSPYAGEEVIVKAFRAGSSTPVSASIIGREYISGQNLGKDLPMLLSRIPSLVASSDAGHGIGYSTFRIRGTDMNRINITMDGVPLNDAESHGVWFVNMPDFATSIENIQVQRGVGTSGNGAAAFGASVNFLSKRTDPEAYGEINSSFGSYNTFRNSIQVGSGTIKDKFNVQIRLSDIKTDGYIERAGSDLSAAQISSSWVSGKDLLKFNLLTGKEKTYQAWDGVPYELLSINRRYNGMGKYTDESGITRYYDNETDNYQQDHYHLHYTRRLKQNMHLNTSLHYTHGEGYYEQYKENQDFAGYGLDYPFVNGSLITETDLIRQKWLKNDFYGAIASLNYRTGKAEWNTGAGVNKYHGRHYGKIIWSRFAGDQEKNNEWYRNKGLKLEWNAFTKLNLEVKEGLFLFGDMQIRSIQYSIKGMDDDLRDITQEHSFLFLNPKTGLSWHPGKRERLYFSFSIANREPNRDNFVDADPEKPYPKPEKLMDYELGYSYTGEKFNTSVNVYYMDYVNQLVLTGEINDVGAPVMTNVKDSYRAGLELQAGLKPLQRISLDAVLGLSANIIREFEWFADNWSYWDDPENEPYQYSGTLRKTPIAFSPPLVLTTQAEWIAGRGTYIRIIPRYVASQFIDNTGSDDRKLEGWSTTDLILEQKFKSKTFTDLKAIIQLANIFNAKYESNAWMYRYYEEGIEKQLNGFFPQAGFHFMAGLMLRF